MDWYSFGLLLYDNIPLYLVILTCSLLFYFLIFRKTYISFLDPLIFNLLYSVFGFSVVIFLYATQSIHARYLWSYLLTQAAFLTGLFWFKPLQKDRIIQTDKPIRRFEEEGILIRILFLVCSSVYVVVQLLSYKLVGIPLFMLSRVGAYADSGGLGLLGRIIDVLRPATIFMLIYLLLMPGKGSFLKVYLTIFTILLLLFFGLSGSKSLFMSLGFIGFIYLLLNAGALREKFMSLRKYEGYILLVGFLFVFITIFVQLQNNSAPEDSSVNIFLYRLVASGDTYYFSYPDGVIETINGSKGFLALFGDIFSVLRIVPRENQPAVLGVQLFQYYYDADLIAGPNARQNVFGYVYYGFYGSILFSFAIGYVLSLLRNRLFFNLKQNVLGQILFMYLYLNMTFVETDPPVAISGIENALLIFPPFLILALLLYVPVYNLKMKKLQNSISPV